MMINMMFTKSLGYALKYSTSRDEFVSKLNKNGMNAEFDDETNITVFESRQGIEYGNYEMYQGEKNIHQTNLKKFL